MKPEECWLYRNRGRHCFKCRLTSVEWEEADKEDEE